MKLEKNARCLCEYRVTAAIYCCRLTVFQKWPGLGTKSRYKLHALPCSPSHLCRRPHKRSRRRAGKAQTRQVSSQTVTRQLLRPQLSPCSVITVCRTTGIKFLEFIIDASLCYQYAGNTAATLWRRDSFMVLIFHKSMI